MASKLGFQDLISLAKSNAAKAEKKAQQTMFPVISKPKKLDPKQKKLSEGIQKFLKEKEHEEKQKLLEAKAKREHLEDLRSQTKGAKRRVGQMLRMTKSANKACIEDAESCLNDSLAAQGELAQPDEDDYGYVSQSAQQWHTKMMENYKKIPAKTITRKPAAPIPVVQSLGSKKAEGNTSGTTSIKHSSTIPKEEEYIPETTKPDKKPPKRKMPPPMDYKTIMQLANEKAQQPVPIAKKPVVQKQDGPEFEYGRPMTAKEKAQYQQEKTYRERIEKGLTNATNSDPVVSNPKPESSTKSNSFKIPSKKAKIATQNIPPPPIPSSTANDKYNANSKTSTKSENIKSQYSPRRYDTAPPLPIKKEREIKEERMESSDVRDYKEEKKRRVAHPGYETQTQPQGIINRDIKIKKEPDSPKRKSNGYSQSSSNQNIKEEPKAPSLIKREPIDDRSKNYRPNDIQGSKYAPQPKPKMPPTKEPPPRQRPPNLNPYLARDPPGPPHPQKRPSPPNPNPYLARDPPSRPPQMRRPPPPNPNPYMDPPRRLPASSQRPPAHKGRAVIDSDDEYDSEMDDFIDDSEVDMAAVSSEISQIFNYRRDKYVDEESDDECMESSLAQQMAEERRSLLIGIKEDKEEEMKEKMEEERKRKRLLEMKKKGAGKR